MSNYVGNKGGQTILPQLLQLIPKAERYFSFFFGCGGLERSKQLHMIKWIVSEKNQDLQLKASAWDLVVFSDYKDLVANHSFTSEDFIFCDPPYLHSSRRSGRDYYSSEFNLQDHVDFLDCVSGLKAKVLITHPFCDLYNQKLAAWYQLPLSYMSHQGWFHDGIYLNYLHSSVELYDYSTLGHDRTQRQMIKRKRESLVSKFNNLSFHEQQAFLEAISCSRNNLQQLSHES